MTAGDTNQKTAKPDAAKREALVLDTAQFYDRAERFLNSKKDRSARKNQSNKKEDHISALATQNKMIIQIGKIV